MRSELTLIPVYAELRPLTRSGPLSPLYVSFHTKAHTHMPIAIIIESILND